jgi:hypothetical protein
MRKRVMNKVSVRSCGMGSGRKRSDPNGKDRMKRRGEKTKEEWC